MAVVAHDAGAARLLFSWIKPLKHQLLFYVKGPALRILEQELPGRTNEDDLMVCLSRAQVLLSGTAWSSDLEHEARLLAADRGIPSIAVVDHWVNYRERFQRDEGFVVPQNLWVADAEAADIAKREFPESLVQQLPNLWLNKLVKDVRVYRNIQKLTEPHNVGCDLLYFLEPLRDHDSGDLTGQEFIALEYWLDKLPKLMAEGHIPKDQKALRIRLRPHPSEPDGKYKAWIEERAHDWPLELDPYDKLASSLAHADITFGCETQALIAAIACGLPAFSTLPPTAPPCRLPHSLLHHLAQY